MNHALAMQGLSTCDLSDACDALGITAVPSVRGRMAIESVNEPLLFAGGHVEPGWIAAADANGVIVFAPERQRDIFERAWRAVALEKKVFAQIQQGGDAIALHKAMKYDLSISEQLGDRSL